MRLSNEAFADLHEAPEAYHIRSLGACFLAHPPPPPLGLDSVSSLASGYGILKV